MLAEATRTHRKVRLVLQLNLRDAVPPRPATEYIAVLVHLKPLWPIRAVGGVIRRKHELGGIRARGAADLLNDQGLNAECLERKNLASDAAL